MTQNSDEKLKEAEGHRSASTEEHRSEAPDAIRCFVVTVSDTRTLETDKGGALIQQLLREAGHEICGRHIVRDDAEAISDAVRTAIEGICDPEVVLVTGGSGIGPRDVTP